MNEQEQKKFRAKGYIEAKEEITKLYAKAQEGYDVVFARRAERHDTKMKIFIYN